MIQRLLLLLLLSLTCGARQLVRLKDGSYGVVLQSLDGKALVAVTSMSRGGFTLTQPQAQVLPWKELHSTQKEAQGNQVMTGDGTIGYVHSCTISIVQLDYPQAKIDAVWKPVAAQSTESCVPSACNAESAICRSSC